MKICVKNEIYGSHKQYIESQKNTIHHLFCCNKIMGLMHNTRNPLTVVIECFSIKNKIKNKKHKNADRRQNGAFMFEF